VLPGHARPGRRRDRERKFGEADAIIDLIRSGAERADLVPQQFGGTYHD